MTARCRTLQRTPSPCLFIPTRNTSPVHSYLEDWDADDEDTMSSLSSVEDNAVSRPLSVAIPQGPFCPRRPTLAEILSNTAPPPYTLSAFMAYLSQNHCLETLEFTMDATRYRKYFNSMSKTDTPLTPDSEGCRHMKMLWQRLLDAYITPNGPREVNLPCDVRDQLLSLPNNYVPPSPDSLDPAVKIVYELMDESVLVPFLNSFQTPVTCDFRYENSEDIMCVGGSLDERLLRRTRSRQGGSPPASVDFVSSSYSSSASSRSSRPTSTSPFSARLGWNQAPYAQSNPNPRTWAPSNGSADSMTDDSGSVSSPSSNTPVTPPTTPPTSDGGMSPRGRSDKTWKKMTGKLGWKKRYGGGSRESRCPVIEDEGGLL